MLSGSKEQGEGLSDASPQPVKLGYVRRKTAAKRRRAAKLECFDSEGEPGEYNSAQPGNFNCVKGKGPLACKCHVKQEPDEGSDVIDISSD